MASDSRPLSPHLQIYRLPLTVVLSIAHRVTGALLALGVLVLVYVLVAAASGPEAYASAHALIVFWPVQLLFVLWTYALFFHFCNGIRHLVWDAGYGFDIDTVDKTSVAVLAVSLALTVLVWGTALIARGGL